MAYFSTRDTKEDPSLFTPWSIHHLVIGMLCYSIMFYLKFSYKINLTISLIIHTIYEINSFYKCYISNVSNDTTLENSIGDTISFLIGFMIANMFVKNEKDVILVMILFLVVYIYFREKNTYG